MYDCVVEKGFIFFKMDFGIEFLKDIFGIVVNLNFWDIGCQWINELMIYGGIEYFFI